MTSQLQQGERKVVPVLGIPIDTLSMNETVSKIVELLQQPGHQWIVTADASGLFRQLEDPELREIYAHAAIATPDSVGVVWAMKRKGVQVQGRVSGVELVSQLCAKSAETGFRIFILGAAPGVAELAAERLRLMHPGCNIVGTRHGYFPPADDSVVADEISQFRPDLLFVALGIPRQEKFIAAQLERTGARIGIGVGGSFDVYSGKAKRAPKVIQKLNAEWLWRVLLNPSKISKVLLLPKFLIAVVRERS